MRYNVIKQGFTIIELALVLLIVGVVMVGILAAYKPYIERQFLNQQEKRMDLVQVALADYITDDPNDPADPAEKRLPCPAPMNAAPTDPNFGMEQCISGAAGSCSNGVCLRDGTGGQLVMVGAIPTKTLNIASNAMMDSLKNRMTYAVSKDLTLANSMPNLTMSGAVEIVEDSGVVTTTAPFALISHGKNKLGATTHDGVTGANCSTSEQGDGENCDDDTVFRSSSTGETNTDGIGDYDDFIRFNFQTSNTVLSGRCPAGQMMVGYDPNAGPICENTGMGTCPDEQIMTGSTPEGPICKTMTEAGLVEDFSSSNNAVSAECVDPSNPSPTSSLPRENSPWQTVRFFNTCGARYCRNRGYDDGMVKESSPTVTIVRCYKLK